MRNKIRSLLCLVAVLLVISEAKTPTEQLDETLSTLMKSASLMGMQYQITNKTHTLYNRNFGFRDGTHEVQNSTVFRVASLSKSVTAAGLMLLVQEGKVKLNESLSNVLGFEVKNPFFPQTQITVEMILSHQSSLIECEPYYTDFLMASAGAKSGSDVPPLESILTPAGKYYNKCLFSSKSKPGTYFEYVNLNFGIAGAIIQKKSGQRFDIYMEERILKSISQGLPEVATFNTGTIKNPNNLGACFETEEGQFDPAVDYYPDGKIPIRNITGYKIGSNGVVFGPQGGMRASASHLTNYIITLSNGGVTPAGKRLLSEKSVSEMLRPRYQFHGVSHGAEVDFHLYGFGLYTSSYRTNDQVIPHTTVRGHIGDAYGLISAYYMFENYTMTYIVNGAQYGYTYDKNSIFEKQRQALNAAAAQFVRSL